MVDIPTPIPETVVENTRDWFRQSLPLMLWRLFLLVGATLIFVAAASNGVALVVTVAGIVFSIIYADDIRGVWSDLWNLDFWVWRV